MKIDNNNVIILDCTFRDGGYYNNWHFTIELVNKYLSVMNASYINYVELGFRLKTKKGFLGSNAYTSDDYLRRLKIPNSLNIGVMINASDLYDYLSVKEAVFCLFPEDKKTSPLDFVRIASHYHELDLSFEASILIKNLGFKVCLNLMQISERSENEIKNFIQKSKKYPIDVLYCADSIGSLNNIDTQNLFKIFNLYCNHIPFGFHAHDNLNLALSNTLIALKNGATWLDSTLSGMGRGPGNTKTEEIVIEIKDSFNKNIDFTLLFDLVYTDFYDMKNQYKWGSNIFYYLSGKWSIHPTYAQTMLVDNRFNSFNIINVLNYLKDEPNKTKFKIELLLNDNRNIHKLNSISNWNSKEIFNDLDVLIIGSGQSLKDHGIEINQFIKKHKPKVLSINYTKIFNIIDIDVICTSHPLRLFSNVNDYINDENIVVIPFSGLNDKEVEILSNKKNIKNFNFIVDDNSFDINNETSCKLPSNLTIAYALGIVMKGNCRNIYLAGIDGYEIGDVRNKELEKVFSCFFSSFPNKNVISLTPSTINGLNIYSVYGF